MKRSEMVNIIWEYIQDIEYDYDCYMKRSNCVELLALIEMVGMLPPNNTCKLIEDGKGGTKHSPTSSEWDPE